MANLRIGLIGCGRIFQKHVQVIQQMDGVEITAVCDIEKSRAKKGSELTGAPAYYSVQSMLKHHELDIVAILTWSGNHAEIGIQCAGAVPNLIVEKPMALQLKDADALIDRCHASGSKLFVVKQNRYNPPVVALRRAMDLGRFGKLVLGTVRVRWCRREDYYKQDAWRGTWALDGGVLTNQASHHIDLLTWLMGPVESVIAKTETFLSPIETEDAGVVLLKFQNGALGIIEATTCARPKDLEGSISILGEKGSVEIAGFAVNELRTWQFEHPHPMDKNIVSTFPPDVYGFGHFEFYKDVIRCIREDKQFSVDGMEGRRSLELINAIYESAETRREVFLRFTPSQCRLGVDTLSDTPKAARNHSKDREA